MESQNRNGIFLLDDKSMVHELLNRVKLQKPEICFIDGQHFVILKNCRFELQGNGLFRFEVGELGREDLQEKGIAVVKEYLKQVKTRVFRNIVFVLGAGASADYLPQSKELLPLLVDQGCEYIVRLLKDFFYVDTESPNYLWPSLSEVLNFIEIALEKNEYLGGDYPIETLENIKNRILDDLCQLLSDRVNASKESDTSYVKLIRNLAKMLVNGLLDQIGFISLNYDPLLDIALKRVVGSKKIDYLLRLEDINIKQEEPGDSKPEIEIKRQIPVVKFHGSMEWMFCPFCSKIYRVNTERGLSRSLLRCRHDGVLLKWFIYPPMKEKHPMPSDIWTVLHLKADDLLREADRVVFIGCSLSEDDSFFRFRVKRCLYNPRKPTSIVVVDAPPKDFARPTSVELNYWHFLGPVDYRPVGFEKFAVDCC